MITRTIAQIAEMIDLENDVTAYEEVVVRGVCIDTRELAEGSLFVPFVGEQVDGHQFVQAALENGAAAALWQKDVPNPPAGLPILLVEDTLLALQELARSYRAQLDVKVIGITGSNGKTTTKDMVSHLLGTTYQVQKTTGNYNNHLGLPLTILQLKEDTEFAVLEMGMSSRGEISFLTKLARPETVIITNVGESHLLHLGSREEIAAAKFEIVDGLREAGLIVYFGDEPLLRKRVSTYKGKAQVKAFGNEKGSDFYVMERSATEVGSNFTTNLFPGRAFHLPILGAHNVLNALAALIVAEHYGVTPERMKEGLARVRLTEMRTEIIAGMNGIQVINDAYNASPTSMKVAIDLLVDLPKKGKKAVVLGDIFELGKKEAVYHFEIGAALNPQEIDYVFTCGHLAKKIAEGARINFPAERVFAHVEKDTLISELKNTLEKDSVVLVKASRGMKLEEVVYALQENSSVKGK